MKMKDSSLRSKIALGGILIVLIPLVIVGTVIFINSSRALEDISKVKAVQIAKSMSSMVQIAIEKDLKTVSSMASDPIIISKASRAEYDGMDEKLADIYNKIGTDYESLAVFDQNGIIRAECLDRNRIGISIADRDYFLAAKRGDTGVGTIVVSKATATPIFGLSAPILSEDGRFVGGVLAVVRTDFLVRYILSLKLGNTGYVFMMDRKGLVIAHPNRNLILKSEMAEEPGVVELTRRMISQETGTIEYIYKGREKVAGFAPLELTGWSIGVTQDRAEIMALAYTNRNLILMVSGLFLFVVILAVFFFSKSLSTPVQKTLNTLNQAVEQAVEGFGIIGLDRKVQFVNPAMAAIIDRPVRELIGEAPYLENTGRIDREEIWGILEQGKMWNGFIKGQRRDGTEFTMNLNITPVRENTGKLICYLAIGRDITRELLMEAQLRQSQKMEAIGTLAGGIAHDFNNILGAIFGYAELTLHSLNDREKCEGFLNEVLKAAVRARDLVSRILIFSRQMEQQKQALMPKPIVREVLKLLRASLPATIEIRETMKSDGTVMADPTQIHQIVMNLCANAGYAMKERGGVLEVTLDDVEVSRELALRHQEIRPGRYLLLRVSDTGGGISPENVDRIFDPFFTTKPHGEGTGLGLSVVHGIVKSMDGIIDIDSRMGKGTVFSVYLPVSSAEVREIEAEVREEARGSSERLLLLDDEVALIQAGKAVLEDLGYSVHAFTDSRSALDTFLKDPHAFDAIVTDYTMPQMTGYELAKKVRTIRKDIPIILCSGYLDKEVESKLQDAGINEFVQKPITRQTIALALRRILDPNPVEKSSP